jgi:hypothetical protein
MDQLPRIPAEFESLGEWRQFTDSDTWHCSWRQRIPGCADQWWVLRYAKATGKSKRVMKGLQYSVRGPATTQVEEDAGVKVLPDMLKGQWCIYRYNQKQSYRDRFKPAPCTRASSNAAKVVADFTRRRLIGKI